MHHALYVPSAWGAGGGKGTCSGACATADHGGDAAGQGLFNLLRCNEVNVRVDATRRNDVAFAADHFSARANDDVNAGLCIWIACFADGHNAAIFQTNIGLHNAPMIDDQCIGHDGVYSAARLWACAGAIASALRLRHAISNGFAAAKFGFISIATCKQGEIFFNFNHELCVCQPDTIAHGRAEHFCVCAFANGCHIYFPFTAGSAPLTKALKP